VEEISVRTGRKTEFVDITGRIREVVRVRAWRDGALLVFVPHTTAGVFINENADPDVRADLAAGAARLAPDDLPWRHAEGNSPAHLKSLLFNPSLYLVIEAGAPALGTWQGVFFAEFDGPRARRVWLKFIAG
jgi:secondary thiamine-phosphate synthase enzyme